MLVIPLTPVSHTRQLSSDNSGQPLALGRQMVTKHEEQDPHRPAHYRAFLRVCFTQRRPAAGPLSARMRYSLPLRRW